MSLTTHFYAQRTTILPLLLVELPTQGYDIQK